MTNLTRRSTLALCGSLRVPPFAISLICALTMLAIQSAQAQAFTVLHTFTGQDGANPSSGLTIGGAGTLYGTTQLGGTYQFGTVFKLVYKGSNWILNPVYEFTGTDDGAYPEAELVIGPNGALYGTAYGAGISQSGTVFELKPPLTVCKAILCYWNVTVLHSFFGPPDAALPEYAPLTFDQSGNIYGTTPQGGQYNTGAVFEVTPSGGGWTESVLHSFSDGNDGGYPYGGVILDAAGNLYGTTGLGGNCCGTIYELTPGSTWTENILYDFSEESSGAQPQSTLIRDQSGNFYGTAAFYGPSGGGTVFELSPSNGNWAFSVLASLNCFIPSGVAPDTLGNLYGVCEHGGAFGQGMVFELTNSDGTWTLHDLHDFMGSDGAQPNDSVALDSAGNLYGTTVFGGNMSDCHGTGCGTVWEIAP